jgi:uncharacterized protein YjbI with pentapeptide repeats
VELVANCSRCAGLCCVAPAFSASSDFAIDKPAGTPCPHLLADSRCGIHDRLRARGFAGCTVYDCFGAGQQVTHVTVPDLSWRAGGAVADEVFAVFEVVRVLHELAWYLTEAADLPAATPIGPELRTALADTARHASADAATLLALDVAGHRASVNELLLRASALARADHPNAAEHRGADLVGADLRWADLRGASLRGARLVGADLRGADLRGADVIGADCRGAELSGADLRDAVFLVQSQLDSARGDAATVLPRHVHRPAHWSGEPAQPG